MGVFGAMLTAVSGLRAQSFSLENISGNIANSQTTGFKRVDTSFVDLVPDTAFRRELAGSVGAFSRLTNTIQGDLQTTNVSTHMALNGEGYFIVQSRTGFANNQPVFGGTDMYTRRGDFTLDKDGYLTNGAGYYLKGSSIDPVTGQAAGGTGGVIRISNDALPARPTTQIEYRANLPSYPATSNANRTTPGSELLDNVSPPLPAVPAPVSAYATNPRPPVAGGTGTVTANDQTTFLSRSIPGGSITVYNSVGAPVNVQLRWAKASSSTYAPATDIWNVYYLENSNATGTGVAWRAANTNITFNSSGQMTSASSVPITGLSVNGTSVGNINLVFGSNGLTQFADANGQASTSLVRQDGYSSGTLDRITVTSDGRITGNYSNGQVSALAEITVAQFSADNFLKRGDGGVYEQTLESGIPTLGLNGTNLIGGSVEGSNTDIAEEFSKMIVTQQAYSANTRVITTSQQMLSDVLNIIR